MESREQIWANAMKAERRGDAAAYEWLLGDVAKSLRILVRGRLSRLGISAHETEDIVQEILIGLHTMRHRWDADRAFLPWFYAIARYKLSDAMRRRRREARYRSDLTLEEWSNVVEVPCEDADRALVDLDHHLSGLSLGQRTVVQALTIEGASVRETAEKLQTSEGAVRVTLHRALQRLASVAGVAPPKPSKGKI
ncbi:sigma-70 family RNA polymerase sigma factor [Rhizobium rhizogenes]|uniref:RNA polymerase sigma factor protein n=1 Tax=Rhizobium rhizogenes (strain K84 / ATCC BAA-868) TaxID=311403 RepID=B9J9N3_RHIR8|nr:RNA polymerase sigma factor protein [Rhizobium rhizogenes K84]